VANHCCAAAHLHHRGGNIFTFDIAMYAVGLTTKPRGFTKQKSCGIKNMTADVRQDEAFDIFQKWLVVENRITVAVINSSPKNVTDFSGIENAFEFTQR